MDIGCYQNIIYIMIKVAVGSKNPVKIKAVEKVFKRYFDDVIIYAVAIDSNLSRQPIGLKDVADGAYKRSISALERIEDASYGVGIEAGLIGFPYSVSGYLNIQVCVIIDRDGYLSIGSSAGFELPRDVVDKLLRDRDIELEDIMEELTGIPKIGEKLGAIHYLSKGSMSREDLSEQAVLTALIPFVNKELYWRE